MVDIQRLRTEAASLRHAVAVAESALLDFDLATAATAGEQAAAGTRPSTAAETDRDHGRAALVDEVATRRGALDGLLRAELDEPVGFDELAAALDPAVPLLLTPVRIETRLRPASGPPTTMQVRIFPDAVHIEEHEPALTDGEVQLGERYWRTVWRAGRTGAERGRIQLAAWDQLAGALGAARAAWVARRLTPVHDDRPEQPLPDDAAEPSPQFPSDLVRRGRAWGRAAHASTLPDRFVVLAYQGDRLVAAKAGRTVPDVVPIGPDLHAGSAAGVADLALRWMIEYSAAEEIGLAVTVPLQGHDPARVPLLSHVLVLGVSASLDPDASAARLEEMLRGHRETGTAEFVAQGSPTNNTVTATRQRTAPLDVDDLLLAGDEIPPSDPLANGNIVARALGVTAQSLARIPGTDDTEQADARALQLALWTATGEHFLDDLMESASRDREAVSAANRDWLRGHFVDNVRARGPLPVLRLGAQPYGLLPVTSFRGWQAGAGEPPALARMHLLLETLRPLWADGVPTLPRVGGPDQPGEHLEVPKAARDVLRALGLSPVSRTVRVRGVRGALNACYRNVLGDIEIQCGDDTPERRFAEALTRALGLDEWLGYQQPVVNLHQNDGGDDPPRLWLPWVRRLPSDGGDPVEVLAGFLEDVVSQVEPLLLATGPEQAATLLEALLRHAANREYAMAAAHTARWGQVVTDAKVRTEEVVFSRTSPADRAALQVKTGLLAKVFHAGALLDAKLPAEADTPIVQLLQADRAVLATEVGKARLGNGRLDADVSIAAKLPKRPWSARLVEADAALQYLARRVRDWHARGEDPFPAVERLLGECLDLVSHRLDAWITSLATTRLAAMRDASRRPHGIQLGSYGWVTDLHPRPEAQRSDGSILAPSLRQATTAAILRSGALAHPSDPGAFAVDLSSRRMRVAMAILDGVRRGQHIGALFGYRLERRLHDAREAAEPADRLELDRFIHPLREIAPLPRLHHPADPLAQAQEFIAAHDVVDGARLAELGTDAALGLLRGRLQGDRPAWSAAEEQALRAALDTLQDDVDAVADLLLADSVHQLAHGNPERAGATLDSLAAGGQPPPRPQVLDLVRSATPVTHRVLVAVPGSLAPAAGWDGQRRQRPRALAEPRLDAWAGHLFGPTERLRLRIAWHVPNVTAPPVITEHAWPLADECALDVVALAADDTLEALLLARSGAQRPSGAPPQAVPQLAHDRDTAWLRTAVGAGELIALARAVAAALAAGRAATAADLAPAAHPPQAEPPADLRNRVTRALDDLDRLLLTAPPDGTGTDEQRREWLQQLAAYGVTDPVTALTGNSAELRAAKASAAKVAKTRLDAARTALNGGSASDADTYALGEALAALFGPGFRAADLFIPPNGAVLNSSLGPDLRRGDPARDPVRTWLDRAGTVRPAVAALSDLLLYADAAGTGRALALRAGQTPFAAGDRWIGADRLDDGSPAPVVPATGLVIHGPDDADLSKPTAALVIDTWAEQIPDEVQSAGVSFHFDAPGARPPNTMLLAMPAVPGAAWTTDSLAALLRETLDLAQLRLVDLETLTWLGRYLPAAYLPDGAIGTTPGIKFKDLVLKTAAKPGFTEFRRAES
ncbi:hypothetical protein [Catellatospora sichuanensis]|uniref:hypothetical protein n=1 Tax=Catellatospora sichuanensis TaxID=1969805 RepID=UPI001183D7FF|nr:hypothetical protein [Catellatospora sichuanensis]